MSRSNPTQEVLDALTQLENEEFERNRREIEVPATDAEVGYVQGAAGPSAWEVAAGVALVDDLLAGIPDDHVIRARLTEYPTDYPVPGDQGIPEDSADWNKDVCPECADVIEPGDEVMTAGIEYEDGTLGQDFKLHVGCVGKFLAEMNPLSGRGNRHIRAVYLDKVWKLTPLES